MGIIYIYKYDIDIIIYVVFKILVILFELKGFD